MSADLVLERDGLRRIGKVEEPECNRRVETHDRDQIPLILLDEFYHHDYSVRSDRRFSRQLICDGSLAPRRITPTFLVRNVLALDVVALDVVALDEVESVLRDQSMCPRVRMRIVHRYPECLRIRLVLESWRQIDGRNRVCLQEAHDLRWQVEKFHRELKQLTGSTKCQCRQSRSQRNHLACCYHAWLSLKVQAKLLNKTIYRVRTDLFSDFLRAELRNPTIPAFQPA